MQWPLAPCSGSNLTSVSFGPSHSVSPAVDWTADLHHRCSESFSSHLQHRRQSHDPCIKRASIQEPFHELSQHSEDLKQQDAHLKKDLQYLLEECQHNGRLADKRLDKTMFGSNLDSKMRDGRQEAMDGRRQETGGDRRREETGDGRRQETGGDRRREETGDGRRQETGGDRRREETGDGRRRETGGDRRREETGDTGKIRGWGKWENERMGSYKIVK
ncbi:hypothetical protein BD769DRAFT_1392818 [Suillus cothurnatus]|nr:hypothetical protein BD769DRAFT_1392818 [Suillus cothurnatus]